MQFDLEYLKHQIRIMDGLKASTVHEFRCGKGVRDFLREKFLPIRSSLPPMLESIPVVDDEDVPEGHVDMVFGDGYKQRVRLI